MVQRDQPQSVITGLAALTVMAFVGIGIANPDFLSFASLSSMGFQWALVHSTDPGRTGPKS